MYLADAKCSGSERASDGRLHPLASPPVVAARVCFVDVRMWRIRLVPSSACPAMSA
jgi:hypothetical protein